MMKMTVASWHHTAMQQSWVTFRAVRSDWCILMLFVCKDSITLNHIIYSVSLKDSAVAKIPQQSHSAVSTWQNEKDTVCKTVISEGTFSSNHTKQPVCIYLNQRLQKCSTKMSKVTLIFLFSVIEIWKNTLEGYQADLVLVWLSILSLLSFGAILHGYTPWGLSEGGSWTGGVLSSSDGTMLAE